MCGIKSEWWVRLVKLRVFGDGSPFIFRILCVPDCQSAGVGGALTDGVRVVAAKNKPERPTSLDSISFVYIVAEKIDDETRYCTPRHAKTLSVVNLCRAKKETHVGKSRLTISYSTTAAPAASLSS
jgi:hypothetical protein